MKLKIGKLLETVTKIAGNSKVKTAIKIDAVLIPAAGVVKEIVKGAEKA